MFSKRCCLLFWVGMLLGALTLASCGGDGSSPEEREAARQKQLRVEQQLTSLQQQIANLDRQIADMRVEQEQNMGQVVSASQALNNQFNTLKSEITGAGSVQAAPSRHAQKLPPERSGWDVLLRVIVGLALLAAIFFLFKFFYGRLRDDEDEDEDEDELLAGGEGAAQPAPDSAPAAADAAASDAVPADAGPKDKTE